MREEAPAVVEEDVNIQEEVAEVTNLREDTVYEVEVPLVKKEEPVSEEISIQADILLHHEESLSSKIYATMLRNLGYTVDIADSTIDFMDKVENNHYHFVLFDADSFMQIHCLIADIVHDAGARPFLFVSVKEIGNICCETLSMEPNVEEIKKKLETSV